MSALKKLILLEKEARGFGFDWPHSHMILDQAIDECREIREAIEEEESRERVQEEVGDLLHTAVSLCIFEGFDVEETLAKVHRKFFARMEEVKKITHGRQLKNLQGQPIELLLDIWHEAKGKTSL